MKREQLKEALTIGRPLAKEYEKLNNKYESAKEPYFISGIILIIIFTFVAIIAVSRRTGASITLVLKDLLNDGMLFVIGFNVILVVLLMFIPIVNLLTKLFVVFIGKCFFFNKQKLLKEEIEKTLDQFIHSTKLPKIYCNTIIINKFIGYLDTYQADNLKECIKLYNEEERHKQILNELENLKSEISAVGEEIHSVSDHVSNLKYK